MRDEPAAPAATAQRAAAAADAAFGADLYRTLAGDAASMVFSPSSVASALRMALCGARGQTAAEFMRRHDDLLRSNGRYALFHKLQFQQHELVESASTVPERIAG